MGKITLTPEQEAMIPVIRDEWLAKGLSTEPANRKDAEKGVRMAYQSAGLTPPGVIIWLRSPIEGAMGTVLVPQFLNALREGLKTRQVGGQVWAQVGDQVGQSLWGQHDAGWLSYLDFFQNVVPISDKAEGLQKVGACSGWWWTFQNVVILTERPNVLKRDERGRLHSADGPAIAYPDGWGVYAWHGVRVPKEVIENPETLTAAGILKVDNAEIRRVMIERMGQDRFLLDANPTVLNADKDQFGRERQLYRVDLDEDEPLVAVKVINSTPEPDGEHKSYLLRVPPEIDTCAKAIAWSFAVDEKLYAPVSET